MPKISVIVPVYKVEPYLHRCVDSILAQTFTDFELILVDDGSPDNCGKICDEYAEKDSRIKVIHQKNGGLSAARNAGLDWVFANSSSEWISFIDSDDFVDPFYLGRLYSTATKENAELAICGYLCVDESGNEVSGSLKCEDKIYDKDDAFQLLSKCLISTVSCVKLFKKELFQNVRFPVGKLHEDEYVIHHLLWECNKISLISDQLYYYVQRESSIMNTKKLVNYLDAFEAFLDRYYFCKEHNLPFDIDIMMSPYSGIRNRRGEVSENDKKRLNRILEEYRRIFFADPRSKTLKKRIGYYFNKTYTFLHIIKKSILK